ncbi:MAG TPA: SEC-C metal-binding domain-containing protein [Bryobacteraceae bacterium]|nr:SEC-C metal-binding domain-containing protein [Bryobacteraceae bacterium]
MSTAVHHISPDSPPFEVANLSPIQVQVVVALTAGRSVTRAAAAAGIHRSTIHNWIRSSKEFRDAVNQARDYFFDCVNEQLNELSAVALDTLRQLLTSPDTPPSLRLRAALAVLERPGHRDPGWQVPLPVGTVMEPAPQRTMRAEMPQLPPSSPRNAPCPCGSGLKRKRCCGDPVKLPGLTSLADRLQGMGT